MINFEPDYDAAIRQINVMNSEQLRELINDEEKLAELIQNLPQMQDLKNEKARLLSSNRSLAELNLNFQPKLTQGKEELTSQYDELTSIQERINTLKEEIAANSQTHSPQDILQLVQKAATEAEDESEALVETFLGQDGPVDPTILEEFLDSFVPGKTLAHERKIRADQAKNIVLNKNPNVRKSITSYGSQGSLYQPAREITTPYTSPYPINLPNMPMPTYPQMHVLQSQAIPEMGHEDESWEFLSIPNT